jgi:sugar/nucleoside kinase (ribokinase family)
MITADVVVAGEIYADLILSGFPAWPQPGQEAFASDFRRDVGGAAITACGLAALGTPTAVLGVIGEDQQEWILARLREYGVDCSRMRVEAGEPTGLTVAITSPADRTFFTYAGANRQLPARLMQAASDGMEGVRHAHLACAPGLDTAKELFRGIQRNGCTLSLDTGWHEDWLRDRRTLDVLEGVDLFFPNLPEAAVLTGEKDPDRILCRFRSAGIRHVVLKLGAGGSALLWDGEITFAAAHPAVALDATGAGDAFDAGFLSCWLHRLPLPLCLRAANICGALTTEACGGAAALPTRERLWRELERAG